MNLIVGTPLWLVAVLVLAVVAAAIEDMLRFRISNITCVVVLTAALIAMGVHGFSLTLWQNAVVCFVVLALGTAAFGAGWLGGGDVKLFATIGLWFDLGASLRLIAAVFIAGGALALVYLATRSFMNSGGRSSDRRVPYGVAIALGGLFILGSQLHPPAANPFIDHLRAQQAARR
ncbi:MAG: prepilin peptidase [Sphingomicrobium sp.]